MSRTAPKAEMSPAALRKFSIEVAIRVRRSTEINLREERHRNSRAGTVNDLEHALAWIRAVDELDPKEALLQIAAMAEAALDALGDRTGPEPDNLALVRKAIRDVSRRPRPAEAKPGAS